MPEDARDLIAACHAFLSAAEETPDVEISIRNGLTAYAQMLRDAPDLVKALLARVAVLEATCEQWAEAQQRAKDSHGRQRDQLRRRIAELEAGPVHAPDRCSFPEGATCVCNSSLREMVNARVADINRIGAERDEALARIAELEQQAAKLRDYAETWAAQEPVDDAEWIEQQISDGRAVLAILDGQPEVNRG